MTRAEYIQAVKVKLEEISPFDEPDSFIASSDGSANTVKPIISYIDKSLDEAAQDCLKSLPLSLLHKDISYQDGNMIISRRGVGVITDIDSTWRLVRFRHPALKRDITAFITSQDPLYLLQQNKYTRGGIAKPVAVLSTDGDNDSGGYIEIYSFPSEYYSSQSQCFLDYIDVKNLGAADVESDIEEYIVLRCAIMVAQILNDINTAEVLQREYDRKLQSVLQ